VARDFFNIGYYTHVTERVSSAFCGDMTDQTRWILFGHKFPGPSFDMLSHWEQLFFAFFCCSIRILVRNPCVLHFKCLGRCGFHLYKLFLGRFQREPELKPHQKKSDIARRGRGARQRRMTEDGGVECPGDWIPDGDIGRGGDMRLRFSRSHDSDNSS